MSTNSTPNTEYVREFYAKFQANLKMGADYEDEAYDIAEAEFDRWLAEHDRAVAAAAWDEGKAVGIEAAVTRQHDGWVEGLKYNAYHPNPYALVPDERTEK